MPTVEARLTSLEERMDEQERLRAAQDQDQSDLGLKLKAQDGLIQGLAATQSEHTATLAKHTAILERHTGILERQTETLDRQTAMHKSHTTELAWLRLQMDGVKDGMERMVGMLHTVIERGDGR
ncbi:hypothetical protein [Actinoplanes regularis]|uniref:Uncharacterized protein n=1 Tax=Actinoplanes regularis TaxID=52697 RepID=A0A239HQ16_9ACTN|nr:hypothetical protein [Actinoplanes regularis]GIE91097.1 hypothetical protein Are01nite_75770 [Actinoplanes regularis]SNS83437.1 hypothetical protein SAMN06264365_12595 [Actinoplanes regularis]